ncbi:MAG: 50S ribosomal protein L9 [Bacilli bacterium]
MKVIFIKDVKGQGKNGEIKEVKDGYGQNFLIRNGYAVACTARSKEILDITNKKKAENEKNDIEKCNKIKEKLLKEHLKFKVQTGKNDQVFGTISSKQVCTQLEELGYDIDKKKVVFDFPASSLGCHKVKIRLHPKVDAIVTIELIK